LHGSRPRSAPNDPQTAQMRRRAPEIPATHRGKYPPSPTRTVRNFERGSPLRPTSLTLPLSRALPHQLSKSPTSPTAPRQGQTCGSFRIMSK
jgi:hypothetical protein